MASGDPIGHYAGPNCYMNYGYNGYKISAGEMEVRDSCAFESCSRWLTSA
jgi:hypothetical protein